MLIVNDLFDHESHVEPGHPERPDRIAAVRTGVADLHLGEALIVTSPRVATREELSRVHDPYFLDELEVFCYEGGGDIDPDTYATRDSWLIAQRAAGAGLAVVDEIARRGEGVGFVATRPPGHHATRDRSMGFCLVNNVAVAAAALTARGERVAVIDWDVHHGNGTQAIFWDDPHVLYVSTHQWPLYPGSGGAREIGGEAALGLTVNLPLPAGATGDVVRRAFEEIATPVVEEFAPTWVLVSAGFDAHRADPLAGLALSSGDFAAIAGIVAAYAPLPGRLAFFLEGGYDLGALRSSVAATLGAVLELRHGVEAPTTGGAGTDEVHRAAVERRIALRVAREGAITERDQP